MGDHREEYDVNFAWILDGRQADMNVYPNDVIFVPGSGKKDVGYGLVGIIPGTLSRGVAR